MFVDAYESVGGDVQIEWFPGMPHRFGITHEKEGDRAIGLMRTFVAKQVGATVR
jgi:hypothetical protein